MSNSPQSQPGVAVLPCQQPSPKKESKPPYTITLACSHRACGNLINGLELVPSKAMSLPYKDECTITYSGPNPPPKIKVSDIGEIKGGGTYKFSPEINPTEWFAEKTGNAHDRGKERRQKHKVIGAIAEVGELAGLSIVDAFRRMWTYHSFEKHRVTGLPVSFPITIYNPEEWEVAIEMPPMKSYKLGAKYGAKSDAGKYSVERTKTERDEKSGQTTTTTTGTRVIDNNKYLHKTPDSKDFEPYNPLTVKEHESKEANKKIDAIKISRNGAPFQIDGLNAILSIIAAINLIKELITAIQDRAPQVGWYVDVDIQILKEKLSMKWGWKEFTDERAYYDVGINGTLSIISASIEFGFGVKSGVATAQVFALGSGEVSVPVNINHHAPGPALKGEVMISGEINLTIGARGKVAYLVKIEVNTSTGVGIYGAFTADSQIDTGIRLGVDIKFLGIKGTISWSVFDGGGAGYTKSKSGSTAGKKESVFMEPVLLYRLEWPKAGALKDIMGTEVNIKEFKNIIQRHCLDFLNFDSDFIKELKQTNNDEIRPLLADQIADKVFAKPIIKTPKGVQGLAIQMKQRLLELEVKSWSRDKITKTDFDHFLNTDLPKMCDDCKDPLKEFVQA